jgi:hypothetical protein
MFPSAYVLSFRIIAGRLRGPAFMMGNRKYFHVSFRRCIILYDPTGDLRLPHHHTTFFSANQAFSGIFKLFVFLWITPAPDCRFI